MTTIIIYQTSKEIGRGNKPINKYQGIRIVIEETKKKIKFK